MTEAQLSTKRPTHLKHLKINELTICENPANQHAFATIFKSADDIEDSPELIISFKLETTTLTATVQLESAIKAQLAKSGLPDDALNRAAISTELLSVDPTLYDAVEIERLAAVKDGTIAKSLGATSQAPVSAHSRVEKLALARVEKFGDSLPFAMVKVMETDAGKIAYEQDEAEKALTGNRVTY